MSPEELDLSDEDTARAVHEVGLRAYRVEADLIGFDGIPALRETLPEMRALALRWRGCRAGGVVVAFVAWADGDIDRLCVDPAWFRRGLATTLLRDLVARTEGDLSVTTGAENAPAVALYERAGFTRTGTLEPEPGLRLAAFRLQRG
ncbi:MAG: GNAT family N-acetyltransferase [Actinomycetota bacterium]|nr:GNAT family N-acetyltransferase [Actinomycetota bacterium]